MFALYRYFVQRLPTYIPEVLELTDKCHAFNSLSTGSLIEDGAMRKMEERGQEHSRPHGPFRFSKPAQPGHEKERLSRHFEISHS